MTDTVSDQRLLSGQGLDDFCEILRLIGRQIERWRDVPNELDGTKWLRKLTRVIRVLLERFVETASQSILACVIRRSGAPSMRKRQIRITRFRSGSSQFVLIARGELRRERGFGMLDGLQPLQSGDVVD